jgi:O-antigen/teichoic acid export membrane protein
MTRTRRAVFGVLTNHASAVVMAIAGFVLVPIVLRYVGREDYGLWATIGQILGYLALFDLGVGSAVVRRAAQLRENNDPLAVNRMVSTAVTLYSVLGGVFLATGIAMTLVLPRWSVIPAARSAAAVTLFAVMIAYTAVSFPLRVAASTLIGFQRMATVNVLNLVGSLLTIVVAVLLLRFGVGVLALPIGSAVAGMTAAIAALVVLRVVIPCLRIRWRYVSKVEALELFSWSWQLFLNNIAVVIIYQTDNLVIAGGAGLEAVTTYTLTSKLPLYAMPLIFALSDSCLPAAVELCEQGNRDRLRSVYLRVLQVTSAAAIGIATIAWIFNDSFMRLWVGEQNYGGSLLTVVFGLILVTRVLNHAASIVIIGSGKLRGVVYMSLTEAALNLALSLWLVRAYGILGVAVGTAIAGVLTSNWYVIHVVCRELRLSAWAYLARGPLPALLAGVPTAIITLAVLRWYSASGWGRLFIAGAGSAALYLMFYALVGLRGSDRRQIFSRVRTTGRAIQTRVQEAF